ncbi:MAG: hypothetical protein QXL01_04370 [Thermoplasmatales archaeon]
MKYLISLLFVVACEDKPSETVTKPTQVHVRCRADVTAEECKKNAESVCPKFKELNVMDEPLTQTKLYILECEKEKE